MFNILKKYKIYKIYKLSYPIFIKCFKNNKENKFTHLLEKELRDENRNKV